MSAPTDAPNDDFPARRPAFDWAALGMGLAFALMWSSAFTSARVIVAEAPPLSALALRFLISGALAVALALALGQSPRLPRAQLAAALTFGLCQNALYLGLFFVAMTTVEASLAAIVASAMPLLVALAGALLGERLPPLGVLGLALGLGGVALVMGSRVSGGADPLGLAFCAAGVVALAAATLLVRGASAPGRLVMVVGLQMLAGAAALALPALLLEGRALLAVRPSVPLALAFGYTVLVPGLLATFTWFRLVGRIGATRAATFHFLNPVFGVAIAWALLGEAAGALDAAGVLVVTAGILAVQLARAR